MIKGELAQATMKRSAPQGVDVEFDVLRVLVAPVKKENL